MIESRGRGVLDHPPSRVTTALCNATPPDLIAPQLCAQDERSKRPEIRASCGFLGRPGLVFSHPIRFHCHSSLSPTDSLS
jgi:hypothetical protein